MNDAEYLDRYGFAYQEIDVLSNQNLIMAALSALIFRIPQVIEKEPELKALADILEKRASPNLSLN